MGYMDPCTRTTPTARRQHTCDSCGRSILPGEKYGRDEGKFDGNWVTWKTCAHCSKVFGRIWTVDRGLFDDEGVDLSEYLREYYPDSDLHRQFLARWADVPVDEISLDTLQPFDPIGGGAS